MASLIDSPLEQKSGKSPNYVFEFISIDDFGNEVHLSNST